MRSAAGRALYLYWNEVRKGRIAPKRFEIEPSRFSDYLPDSFILERISEKTLRFRLAGTRISTAFGADFRGKNFYHLFQGEDRRIVKAQIDRITSHGAVGELSLGATTDTGEGCVFECCLMPLQHTNDVVDRFIGTLAPITAPKWIGLQPVKPDRLVSHTLVWPEGRPQVALDQKHRQSPFGPHIRHARIVRAERRQFRVYDGGLADQTTAETTEKR